MLECMAVAHAAGKRLWSPAPAVAAPPSRTPIQGRTAASAVHRVVWLPAAVRLPPRMLARLRTTADWCQRNKLAAARAERTALRQASGVGHTGGSPLRSPAVTQHDSQLHVQWSEPSEVTSAVSN